MTTASPRTPTTKLAAYPKRACVTPEAAPLLAVLDGIAVATVFEVPALATVTAAELTVFH
jgi:hypothetical protein